MRLQVLIPVMNLKNEKKFIKEKNLQTSAIIINQCDHFDYQEIGNVRIYSFAERGVGLSRNSSLMRADADIVLFADDDIKYVDDYEKIVVEEFQQNPKADIIVFNVVNEDTKRKGVWIEKGHRIHKFNSLKYGTVHFAARLNRIREKSITFSLLFGGGAKYMCGEDSLFMFECLNKGLKVYASNKLIATIKNGESSWFKGYTENYFADKAVLFKMLFPHFTILFCFIFLIRHRKTMCKDINFFQAFRIMKKRLKEPI